jgi:hypothetical protein
MAHALATMTLLLTDNIRCCLERAGKSNDIAEVRSVLTDAGRYLDQLVASVKAAEQSDQAALTLSRAGV